MAAVMPATDTGEATRAAASPGTGRESDGGGISIDGVSHEYRPQRGRPVLALDDITLDGIATSTVPRRSFCISSLSLPSWLEPKTTTLALLPSFSFARRANSLADNSNSEPGPPTGPARARSKTPARATATARRMRQRRRTEASKRA